MLNSQNIKSRAISASLWAIIAKFSLLISQFIISIVLARLLNPSDFGLVALTTIFITISGAITDGGFETALIQKKELSNIQINTAFYLNILLGCLMTLILFFTSPYIAVFFREPRLIRVLRILSLSLPLEAIGQTQRTLLIKELEFKKISITQIVSSMAGGILGITLAYNNFGVWALVYSTLFTLIIRDFCFWFRAAWYPKLVFSYSSIATLVPFGLNVLGTSILYFFIQQFNALIVGKYYSERDLGLFNRGMKFPDIVVSIIESVVLKMALPLFSKLQDDEQKLNNLIQKTNTLISLISFPLLLFLFIDAKEIITLLLTAKWLEAVVYLKIFCVIKLFDPFITVQRELLLARGKSRLALVLFMVTSGIEVISILLFATMGIMYIVWIILISKAIQYLIYLTVDSKGLNTDMLKQLSFIFSYSFISVVVVLGIRLIDSLSAGVINEGLIQKLTIDFLIGMITYFFMCYKLRHKDVVVLKDIWQSINFKKFQPFRG